MVSFLAGIVLGVTSSVISQAIDNQIEYPNPINSPLLGSLIYLTFAGVIFAALIGLFAVIRKKERAILVYAIIPPGSILLIIVILFLLANLFGPPNA